MDISLVFFAMVPVIVVLGLFVMPFIYQMHHNYLEAKYNWKPIQEINIETEENKDEEC
jgi:hypothetical protein